MSHCHFVSWVEFSSLCLWEDNLFTVFIKSLGHNLNFHFIALDNPVSRIWPFLIVLSLKTNNSLSSVESVIRDFIPWWWCLSLIYRQIQLVELWFLFFHVFLSYVCLRYMSSEDFESADNIACISVLLLFCRICIYITFYKDTPVERSYSVTPSTVSDVWYLCLLCLRRLYYRSTHRCTRNRDWRISKGSPPGNAALIFLVVVVVIVIVVVIWMW